MAGAMARIAPAASACAATISRAEEWVTPDSRGLSRRPALAHAQGE